MAASLKVEVAGSLFKFYLRTFSQIQLLRFDSGATSKESNGA